MIRTTIHIPQHISFKVSLFSVRTGKSYNEILVALAGRMIREAGWRRFCMRPVRYQRRREDSLWRTVHVALPDEVYQKCVDLRGLFKFSVSWFFSHAVEWFLDDVVSRLTDVDKRDNNQEFYEITLFVQNKGLFYVVCHAPANEIRKE